MRVYVAPGRHNTVTELWKPVSAGSSRRPMPMRAPITLVTWRWFPTKNLMALVSSGKRLRLDDCIHRPLHRWCPTRTHHVAAA
eukprot:437873-Lingulodinium_polyedra.AAC.1